MTPSAIAETAARIDSALAEELEKRIGWHAGLAPNLAPALEALREYAARPGKRLRGALVLCGARAAGGDEAKVLPAALAIELLHLHLLVLDDIMDGDLTRRGGPALHAALGGDRRGESLATTLAGLLHGWALELLASCEPSPTALGQWAAMVASVNFGQALDVAPPPLDELTMNDVVRIHAFKTASYTFMGPLQLGVSLAGGKPEVEMALLAYGAPAGHAFQIADDLLGAFGDPARTGKPSGADLAARKPTFVLMAALDADREGTLAALAGDVDVPRLQERLRALGIPERCRREALEAAAFAKAELEHAPLPPDVRAFLSALADLAADRSS